MHAPGLVWRGATSAPFPGYMLIGRGADFATTLTSASRRHHRPVRRDALRRQRYQIPLPGQVPVNGHASTPVYLKGSNGIAGPEGHVPHDRARPGDGIRHRQGPHRSPFPRKRSSYGKDALDLLLYRDLSTGAVDSPQTFFAGRQPVAADVQLLLHRLQAHRRIHLRPAAGPAGVARPRAADRRHRQRRMAGLPQCRRASARHRTRSGAGSSTGTTTSPRGSALRTTSGCAPARSAGSTCSTRTSTGSSPTASGRWPA